MSPDEVLEKHSAYRLQQWRIFDLLSPIGARRGDIQAATIVQALDRYLVSRQIGSRLPPLTDFIFEGDNRTWLRDHVSFDPIDEAAGREKLRLYHVNVAKAKETVRLRKAAKAQAAQEEAKKRKAERRGQRCKAHNPD